MKVLVMGAGALGGYFGGRLAAAGHEVIFIARGAHLDAMRSGGLRIESPKGDLLLDRVTATDDPREAGQVDVVLFTVKNRDVETAARAILPALGPDSFAVTVQNGVTAPDRLAAVIGGERAVPGVARTPGEIAAPGVVRHTAPFDILRFGEADGRASERTRAFAAALSEAGPDAAAIENIRHELWSKFCMQATLASLTALTGLDVGPLLETEPSARLFRDAIAETHAVGRAALPGLPDDLAERNWDFVRKLPPHMHASMLDDLRRGRPIEHEYLSGDVVRIGRQHGVPTPIHDVLYAALKPIADRLERGAG